MPDRDLQIRHIDAPDGVANNTPRESVGTWDRGRWFEIFLVFAVFAAFGFEAVPGVNEAHYLSKAKHFWDATWCPSDLFLGSGFPHLAFYWLFGWLTKFCSLTVTAWVGRIACWLFLAFAWQFFCRQFFSGAWAMAVSAASFVLINFTFHLSGEWVVGGVEAKCIAYAFLILGMAMLVQKRWTAVWPLMGAAAAFHVLVGGWGMVASVVVAFLARERWFESWREVGSMLVGLAIGLLGLVPALLLSQHANSEAVAVANEIYVRLRISHHLHFWSFDKSRIFLFMLAVLTWSLLRKTGTPNVRVQLLDLFCLATLTIAAGGVLLASLPDSRYFYGLSNSLLRFYWFRLSDVVVPVFVSIFIVRQIRSLKPTWTCSFPLKLGAVIIVVAGFLWHAEKRVNDPRPGADRQSLLSFPGNRERTLGTHRNWIKACQWIRDHTDPEARFLTPSAQQTFKWYAHRVDIACWKDIPQDAANMVTWLAWMEQIHPPGDADFGLYSRNDSDLREIATYLKADYIVIEQQLVDFVTINGRPIRLEQVYPASADEKSSYVVFRF